MTGNVAFDVGGAYSKRGRGKYMRPDAIFVQHESSSLRWAFSWGR